MCLVCGWGGVCGVWAYGCASSSPPAKASKNPHWHHLPRHTAHKPAHNTTQHNTQAEEGGRKRPCTRERGGAGLCLLCFSRPCIHVHSLIYTIPHKKCWSLSPYITRSLGLAGPAAAAACYTVHSTQKHTPSAAPPPPQDKTKGGGGCVRGRRWRLLGAGVLGDGLLVCGGG